MSEPAVPLVLSRITIATTRSLVGAWCTAVITPVPKCTPITGPGDLRPTSVTPIMSRVVELLVVKDHILRTIPIDDLRDQYGFKPTGSTTASIINITHAVTVMLESNKYVRCLLVDFSKAFDSVDHLVLVKKLKRYNFADNIINWIVSFLTDRDQFTKLRDLRSFTRVINRSIV